MRRGTAPTFEFTLPIEVESLKTIWITFAQNDKEVFTIEKEACKKVSDKTLRATLTQSQTLSLNASLDVEIQIRALTLEGVPLASNIMASSVDRILKDGEIQ